MNYQWLKKLVISGLSMPALVWANSQLPKVDFYEQPASIMTEIKHLIQQKLDIASDETLRVEVHKKVNLTQIPTCKEGYTFSFMDDRYYQGHTTVIAQCFSSNEKLYLPISIKVMTPVLVSKHHLPRHQRITQADIKSSLLNKYKLRNGYFKDPKALLGKVTKRSISAGTILNQRNIAEPILVRRGAVVNIRKTIGSVKVQMKGIALAQGRMHDVISVRNLKSKKTISAQVASGDTVIPI